MHFLLKNEREELFLTLLKEKVNQTVNQINQVNLLYVWMQATYIIGQ